MVGIGIGSVSRTLNRTKQWPYQRELSSRPADAEISINFAESHKRERPKLAPHSTPHIRNHDNIDKIRQLMQLRLHRHGRAVLMQWPSIRRKNWVVRSLYGSGS